VKSKSRDKGYEEPKDPQKKKGLTENQPKTQ